MFSCISHENKATNPERPPDQTKWLVFGMVHGFRIPDPYQGAKLFGRLRLPGKKKPWKSTTILKNDGSFWMMIHPDLKDSGS